MQRSFSAIVFAMAVLIMLTGAAIPANLAAAAQNRLPFDDIRENYATDAIINMSHRQIISGTSARTFAPDRFITRAEFVTMIGRFLGLEPVPSAVPAFDDVPRTSWFYPWVQGAVQLDIVSGTSNTRFEPNRTVTREEAAVMIARAFKQSVSSLTDVPDSLYQDQKRIHDWALPAVYRLWTIDLMIGNQGAFRPLDPISRQDAAVLMNQAWTRSGWSDQLLASPTTPNIQLGWQYGQTSEQFEGQVLQSNVNTLSPRWFFLGDSGMLENEADASLVVWAHTHGKQVWAMVGNHSDSVSTHEMLWDSSLRRSFIQKLSLLAKQYSLDGLNIDFENMLPEDRDSFTTFVTELHTALQSVSAVLSVNVSPDFGTDWTDVFDYAALGSNADYVVLMGYDEHWGSSQDAGSVASLPWLKQGLEAMLSKVPARKAILAIPLYTRDWAVDANGKVRSAEWSLVQQNNTIAAKRLKPVWDDSIGQYYAQFAEPTALNRIWMEDGRSLARKMSLGASYSLAGYGYWYIGGESVDIWISLKNAMKFSSYTFS